MENTMYVEQGLQRGESKENVDDDGREKRTGTFWTASSHIITAVIGSGVLSLAWAMAQLGWVAGCIAQFMFALITYYTSMLLADCYRSPGPVLGKRNYIYMDAVRAHLGGIQVTLCGVAQYGNLVGVTIGYTITASISMVAVYKSNCYHFKGHDAHCKLVEYPYMAIMGILQIILSQIPNFHKLSWLSILAAVMSFAYSTIGVGLSIAKVADNISKGIYVKTTMTGTVIGEDKTATTSTDKMWHCFQAVGNIAFAYAFTSILIEIQDTLRSSPPENKVMKRSAVAGICTTTLFYVLCGTVGYAAFGNDAPGNFLTGFGFYEPFWLIDIANIAIAVHLIGAYQVFSQPIYHKVETHCNERWANNKFITSEHAINVPCLGIYYVNYFRLIWRTIYVIITSVIAMTFPFFNAIVGLIGAGSFYPLTVYFPIEMHIAQKNIPKGSFKWICLQILSWVCLIVSLLAAAGSIKGLIEEVQVFKPFAS